MGNYRCHEKSEIYDRAHDLHTQLMKDGAPRHKLASRTAEAVDQTHRTMCRWATNANWHPEAEEDKMKLTRQIAKDIILTFLTIVRFM